MFSTQNLRLNCDSPNFYRWWSISTLVLFLVTAWLTVGALHPDEYFQQIAFAGLKLGLVVATSLPWEYHEAIRPWLQPLINALIMKISIAAGLENPFNWLLSLRLFYALIGWAASLTLAKCIPKWIEDKNLQAYALLLHSFCHLTAFLHARTSSENLSTCLMVFATGVLLNQYKHKFWAAGILFGLMFQTRYQTAFIGLGAVAWMALIQKSKFNDILKTIAGGSVGLIAGLAADYFGYGKFVIAPLGYARINIIEERAASFGVSPWWDYFSSANSLYLFPWGTIALTITLVFFVKFRRHLLTWMLLPFLFIHFVIGHKEPRFILSVLYFVPIFTLIIVAKLNNLRVATSFKRLQSSYSGRVIMGSCIAAFLLVTIFSNIRFNFSPLQKNLAMLEVVTSHLLKTNKKASMLYYFENLKYAKANNPMTFGDLEMSLLYPPGLTAGKVLSIKEFNESQLKKQADECILFYRQNKINEQIPMTEPEGCTLIGSTASRFDRFFLELAADSLVGRLFRRTKVGSRVSEIFECSSGAIARVAELPLVN